MDHAFGREAPFALGVEEELFLVDAATLALAHEAAAVLARAKPAGGELKHDTYEATVESASPVVADALAGTRALDALRASVRDAGATLLGGGLHPSAAFGDVVHAPLPRYQAIVRATRGLITRTPTCAVHVHVGMPDPETAIACCNRMRAWLPVLQGLAAHSPFWHAIDSGFQSARAQVFRGFPRAVVPRAFAGWEDYAETVDEWVRMGELEDYTFLWWDLRPHPKLGTLEVRAMDGQSRVASVAGLATLVHGLARASAEGATGAGPDSAEGIAESSFRAGRDGLEATVWWKERFTPLRAVTEEALALARPYAREVGAEGALDEVERILREGSGADRMRAAHAEGGMRAMLEALAVETATPL